MTAHGKSIDKRLILNDQKRKEREYWLEKLSGEPVKSSFPSDRKKRELAKPVVDTVKAGLPPEVSARLIGLSRESDVMLHMILAAAVDILLWKYTGSLDILLGVPIYKQEIDAQFINTVLPLRVRFNEDITFKELLLLVRETVIKANENQNFPIELLTSHLNLPSTEDKFDLFDVTVLLESIHDKKYLANSNYNITFFFSRTGHHIEALLEYNSLLYDRETLERIMKHFIRILRVILFNVDIKISAVDILSEEEKNQILYHFNATEADYNKKKTIPQLFEEQVMKTPESTAVVFAGRRLTYSQLNESTNQLAHLLQKKGVKPDSIVGIMVERCLEMIVGILAILKAGGAYLPIEPTTPGNRIVSLLEGCSVEILLTMEHIVVKHSYRDLQGLQSTKMKPYITPPCPQVVDLDSLPIPDRSLVNYEEYNKYIGLAMAKNSITLQATRGCPYHCVYCSKIWPNKHVVRSAENLFREVLLYYDMGVRRFDFIDDIFNLNEKESKRFFQLVTNKKLDVQFFFSAGLRGDILTEDYIDRMIEAGTVNIALALETASPRLQRLVKKNLNIEKLRKNIEYICKKYPQVILELFTMHGFPTETEAEAMMTLNFITSLEWLHFPYIHILKIYRNTDMEKLALENGISREAIDRAGGLAYHELPDTLPFARDFTIEYQSRFLNDYFFSKDRLLCVLPHQMRVLTEDEIVQKYNSYLPVDINNFSQLLQFFEINKSELFPGSCVGCVDEERIRVKDLNRQMQAHFPAAAPADHALRVLLLDLSQFFSSSTKAHYDPVEPPLGLMYLMTYLKKRFGSKINGKIGKSRIDFDNYEQLKNLLDQFRPQLIGIRTLTIYKDFFHHTISIIRKWKINVPVIAGGPYATSDYETLLQDENVDLVVLGEGEVSFCQVVEKIIDNDGQLPDESVLREMEGIAFLPGKNRRNEEQKHSVREIIRMDTLETALAMEPGTNPKPVNQAGDLAYVIHTSGSTGKPKGILVEHKNVNNLVFALNKIIYNKYYNGLNVALVAPYVFDASVQQIFAALLQGHGLYIIPEELRRDTVGLLEFYKHYKIDISDGTPTLLRMLVETIKAGNSPGSDMKHFLIGGEVLPRQTVEEFFHCYKTSPPKITNVYGPTECCVDSTFYEITTENIKTVDDIPIGVPMPNEQIYILNKKNELQPVGVPGELCISGDGVSRGYIGSAELSAEKFTENPFVGGKRLYRTMDMARWLPDGNIQFLGRIDQQVKISGFRIELGEIESILQKYDQIKEVVVTVKEWGAGNPVGLERVSKYLCAYFVSDQVIEASALREFLSVHLPAYMIPANFVRLRALPRTMSGKINRNTLPNAEILESGNDSGYVKPGNALEKKMVEILQEVLDKDMIGVNENFLTIGGDSIKAIQLCAKMKKAGYKLEMKDIFHYPTISQMALRLRKTEWVAEQSEVTGRVPLTPIQVRFFQMSKIDPHHYNQAVMLDAKEGVDEKAIETIFGKILQHHDGLRMNYREENGTIIQTCHGIEYPPSLQVFDLRNQDNWRETLLEKANQIQASIDLENGPIMKLGLFHLDDGDRLLIVIHHLVVDGVSWRLLFEDIDTLLQQYKKGEKLQLPQKSNSFKLWAEKLSQYADSEELLNEKTYWSQLVSSAVPRVKKDFDEESNNLEDEVSLSFSLSEQETSLALGKANRAFGTQIGDLLLIGIGLAINKIYGHKRLILDVEGHGREELFENVEVTRTIGWFTTLYPVVLNFSYVGHLTRQVKEIKENLRKVPNKGIGYGILKYLTSEEHKREIDIKLKPQICFNYLGQFDSDVTRLSSFVIAEESPGDTRSKKAEREYDLEVSAVTADKQLVISMAYNKKQFKATTIETLLNHYKTELSRLISYCSARKNIEPTPGDFTYPELSIEDLDKLLSEYVVEDIYTLTPMQEGMLFHSLYDHSSTYFEQLSYRFHGELEPVFIEKSLNQLFSRHDILRTAFVHDLGKRPLQVVLKDRQAEFTFKDIRQVGEGKGDASEEYIREFKDKDRARSFDLSKDVLIRLTVLQIGGFDYEFIWSFYHILTDGWSTTILISEFWEIYNSYLENRPYILSPVKSYRVYIEWLENRNQEESRIYWKNYLESYHQLTGIPKQEAFENPGIQKFKNCLVDIRIDSGKTKGLKRLAAENQVTLNTVIQSVWGIILGKYIGKKDILFGAVVSGRPSEIEGVEFMVGLFLNTIPVRIRFEGKMKFRRLLQQVQNEAIASEPHHYFPLAEIQSASPLKQNLLDHILIFRNFPTVQFHEASARKEKDNQTPPLTLSNFEAFEQVNYDLNLGVTSGQQLAISFKYNGCVYEKETLERILNYFDNVFSQILENPEIKIDGITLIKEKEKIQLLDDFNDELENE
jgi:amino acid adenylation domain-containing protein/non-ribosomal peptide synthase protein (TIGR01720 family)